MTRTELIAALEAAEGPSRELNFAIHKVTGIPLENYGGAYGEKAHTLKSLGPKPFTESIDAALSFTPEGWEWEISTRAPKPLGGRAWVYNGEPQLSPMGTMSNPKYRGFENTAATPAIALCIANLRALETQNDRTNPRQ